MERRLILRVRNNRFVFGHRWVISVYYSCFLNPREKNYMYVNSSILYRSFWICCLYSNDLSNYLQRRNQIQIAKNQRWNVSLLPSKVRRNGLFWLPQERASLAKVYGHPIKERVTEGNEWLMEWPKTFARRASDWGSQNKPLRRTLEGSSDIVRMSRGSTNTLLLLVGTATSEAINICERSERERSEPRLS